MIHENQHYGFLAEKYCGKKLVNQVLSVGSPCSYYIGTVSEDGLPFSIESDVYYATREMAEAALVLGDWPQWINLYKS